MLKKIRNWFQPFQSKELTNMSLKFCQESVPLQTETVNQVILTLKEQKQDKN